MYTLTPVGNQTIIIIRSTQDILINQNTCCLLSRPLRVGQWPTTQSLLVSISFNQPCQRMKMAKLEICAWHKTRNEMPWIKEYPVHCIEHLILIQMLIPVAQFQCGCSDNEREFHERNYHLNQKFMFSVSTDYVSDYSLFHLVHYT